MENCTFIQKIVDQVQPLKVLLKEIADSIVQSEEADNSLGKM